MDQETAELRRALERVVTPKTDEVLDALIQLGFEPDTVEAIELVPLVFVAWANGRVARKKADLIMAFADADHCGPASNEKLETLLAFQPDDAYLRRTLRVIVRMHSAMPDPKATRAKRTLLERAQQVACAGGLLLGLGRGKASDAESQLIERITKDLRVLRVERAAALKEKLITTGMTQDDLARLKVLVGADKANSPDDRER